MRGIIVNNNDNNNKINCSFLECSPRDILMAPSQEPPSVSSVQSRDHFRDVMLCPFQDESTLIAVVLFFPADAMNEL